jgi:hypothetical protein
MKTVEQLQQSKGTFSISEALSDGWNLVSKYLGYYIGAGVLTVVIGMGVGFIPVVGGIANSLVISPCFMASAILITWHIAKGYGWSDFGKMFKGFDYAQPVIISNLIQAALTFGLAALCFFSVVPEIMELYEMSQGADAYQNKDEMIAIIKSIFLTPKTFLLFGFFILATLIISAIWAFKYHFIVVYNMQAWPAMELSRKVCTPNLPKLVGLFFILGIILIVSFIPCGIGALFSLPLSIGAVYSAFAQITGSSQPDEVNDIFDFTNENSKG